MKYIASLIITVLSIGLLSFNYTDHVPAEKQDQQETNNQIDIPDSVKSVLDRSCLPCHGPDGSGKAKMKWNYDKMPEYSKTKLISKLIKITEEVDDGKMPPPKKLKKHPELKLSAEDKDLLISWAENAAEQLTGGAE